MIPFLLIFLCLIAAFSGSISGFSYSDISVSNPNREGFKAANARLPTSPKDGLVLVADSDGTLFLVDANARNALSIFSSGSSIYSSYQAPIIHDGDNQKASEPKNDFFIEVGDNGELNRHDSSGKQKLSMSVEEFVRLTPVESDDGYTLGSKKSVVFTVDAKSGRVVHIFGSAGSASMLEVQTAEDKPVLSGNNDEKLEEFGAVDLKTVEQQVHIERTDYELEHFSKKSGKLAWNVTFAKFNAKLNGTCQCQEIENSFGGVSSDSGNELSSEYTDNDGPLLHCPPSHCQKKVPVYQFRDRSFSESSSVFNSLLNAHPKGIALSLPGERRLALPALDRNPFIEPVDKLMMTHHPMVKWQATLPEATSLSIAPTTLMPPFGLQTRITKPSVAHHPDEGKTMLALPTPKIEDSEILDIHGGGADKVNSTSISVELISGSLVRVFIPILLPLLSIMGFIFYRSFSFGEQGELNKNAEGFKVQAGTPKKKKARKSGNKTSSASFEKRQKNMSHDNEVGETNELKHFEINESNLQLPFTNLVDGHVDGRKIGKLLVSNIEIAKGSNGTIVLEGIYDGRPVAVKRLVRTHHDVALKEIQNLIAADQHPNIVRWYGVENDQDFVYLSLERCTCSLNDLVYVYSPSSQCQIITKDWDFNFSNEYAVRLHSIMGNKKDLELWKANGYPSPLLLKLMRDIVSGLAHLHELGIIHRDLKPQNVLIIKERSLCAKLSDMGISKRLVGDTSSLTQHATGYGSSGWQAPEQLNRKRHTRAVDLFSLGCVLFFCVTGGKHPFGDNFERDVNIVKNQKDLFLVENIPEAVDLFSHLLDPNPDSRPKALEILHHPFFWSSEMRLSFLRDVSDRVELEDRENESELLKALESTAAVALNGKWDEKLESAFLNNIGRYRRYKFDSIRDLLRVIRNKLNHYRELPQEIRELLGQVPDGFDAYFSSRFPRLLIEAYKVIYRYCGEEEFFYKYFKSSLI